MTVYVAGWAFVLPIALFNAHVDHWGEIVWAIVLGSVIHPVGWVLIGGFACLAYANHQWLRRLCSEHEANSLPSRWKV